MAMVLNRRLLRLPIVSEYRRQRQCQCRHPLIRHEADSTTCPWYLDRLLGPQRSCRQICLLVLLSVLGRRHMRHHLAVPNMQARRHIMFPEANYLLRADHGLKRRFSFRRSEPSQTSLGYAHRGSNHGLGGSGQVELILEA